MVLSIDNFVPMCEYSATSFEANKCY